MTEKPHDYDRGAGAFERFATAWTRSIEGMVSTAIEANRATLAALSGPTDATAETPDETTPSELPSVAYSTPDWRVDRSVDSRDEIGVGDYVEFTKTITEEDVRGFAAISGDTNRLHLDEEFAEDTRFGEPIAHGALVSGLISAALARLPGLTIYLSQDQQFLAPVEIGDTVTARCEVVEVLGGDRFRLRTSVTDEAGETVIEGEAVVLVDEVA